MSNNVIFRAVFMAILFLWLMPSYADIHPKIELENFRVTLPPAVARSTAGYGIIKNTGNAADTLLNISSDGGDVMLHKTDISSGMARMIHMSNSVIEAGGELVLEPMSFHLMFTELCPVTFTEGGKVTISFEFEKSGIIDLEVPLKSAW